MGADNLDGILFRGNGQIFPCSCLPGRVGVGMSRGSALSPALSKLLPTHCFRLCCNFLESGLYFLPLQEHILPKPRAYYRVDQSAEPDVWLDAVQVWEVKCADLSLSPVHKAALGMVSYLCGLLLEGAIVHHRDWFSWLSYANYEAIMP